MLNYRSSYGYVSRQNVPSALSRAFAVSQRAEVGAAALLAGEVRACHATQRAGRGEDIRQTYGKLGADDLAVRESDACALPKNVWIGPLRKMRTFETLQIGSRLKSSLVCALLFEDLSVWWVMLSNLE